MTGPGRNVGHLTVRLPYEGVLVTLRAGLQPLLYPYDEATELLRISRTKLYELIGDGDLIPVEVGRKKLIAEQDLLLFVERLRRAAGISISAPAREALDDNPDQRDVLLGAAELGHYLGVSRQRASQLAASSDFPAPYASLAAGPVWREKDVASWLDKAGRRKGAQ